MAAEVALGGTRRKSRAESEAPRRRSRGDRPIPVVTMEELSSVNDSVNMLVHSEAGVGKTAICGMLPRATFLATEAGVVAAKQAGSKAKRIQAPTWDHVEAGMDLLDAKLGIGDWAIVDSASKMQVLLSRWILEIVVEENETRDLDILSIQDHQKWQNMYKRYWDRLINAPYNVCFIATSMKREDPDGEDLILPAITGKDYDIASYCMAQVDIGLHMVMEGQGKKNAAQRIIRTQPDPPYWAKNRFRLANIPPKILVEDGDFGTIARMVAAIEKSGGKKASAA